MREQNSRVFVLDDDPSVVRSVSNLLESDGYEVECFFNSREYLARKPHLGPACLILDVFLPGLDGLSLQRHLAETGRIEQIVFMTGHGDISMGIQAMKWGAIDFLPKPFEDQALLNAVAQAIARSVDSWGDREQAAAIRARIATLTPGSSKSSAW